MCTIASKITNLTTVYSTVYSDADQRKHQSSAPLAFVWGRKMFPFDDAIMELPICQTSNIWPLSYWYDSHLSELPEIDYTE